MANDEIILAYEDTHLPELLPHCQGGHYLEENAFGVLGESGDYDIMATYLSYIIGGRAWGVDKQYTRLSCFMAIPKNMRGKMHDNDFISNRVDPIFNTGEFKYTREPDKITLDIAGQQIVSYPPCWELKGEPHNNIKFDIKCKSNSPASWSLGHYEDMIENGMAGYDQGIDVTGSITANGVEYKLDPGSLGNREYVTIGDKWVNGDILKRYSEHKYIFASNGEAEAFIWVKGAMGMRIGRTVINGNNMAFEPDQITVEETGHWVDPRTGLTLPTKVHVSMKSDEGSADLEVAAYARYMYSFCQKDGIITYVATLSRTNGEIVQNGKKVIMDDARTQYEIGIYTLPLSVG